MSRGSLRLRGRLWWMRYYDHGLRVEESARTDDKPTAERLLAQRMKERRYKRPCEACGELPEHGPRTFSVAWPKRVQRRYNGRLPNVAVLEMLHEKEVWSRLNKRLSA